MSVPLRTKYGKAYHSKVATPRSLIGSESIGFGHRPGLLGDRLGTGVVHEILHRRPIRFVRRWRCRRGEEWHDTMLQAIRGLKPWVGAEEGSLNRVDSDVFIMNLYDTVNGRYRLYLSLSAVGRCWESEEARLV